MKSALRRVKWVAQAIGAVGFVVLVFGWFALHRYPALREMELRLAAGEHRDVDLAVPGGGRVVVSGWTRPGWAVPSGDYGEILAVDRSGAEVEHLHDGTGPYWLEGAIDRVTFTAGGAPTEVALRVLREETVARLESDERLCQALIVALLVLFLPLLVAPLSPWMARERSTPHLRRRIGWIGIAIVGTPVLYAAVSAVISRIEGRHAVPSVVDSAGLLSWALGLWVPAIVVIAFASLERRAIGGPLLEMRASPRAVATGAILVGIGWLTWKLIGSAVSDLPHGPYRLDSTNDFPAAVALALSAGITEEVIYRGFLLTRLRELTGDAVGPLLATSAAFGLAHVYDSGWHGLETAVFGLAAGIVTLKTRNLYPAILAHAAYDLLCTVATACDVAYVPA